MAELITKKDITKKDMKALDDISAIIKKHFDSQGGFIDTRSVLEKEGYNVSFAFEPIPYFIAHKKNEPHFLLCNENNIEVGNTTVIIGTTAIDFVQISNNRGN